MTGVTSYLRDTTARRALCVICSILLPAMLIGCSNSGSSKKPRNAHWNDKATLSERTAERGVGGFNADERRAYQLGLQHVMNTHQKIGSLTIAQVVDQEHAREWSRLTQAAAQRQRLAAAKAAAQAAVLARHSKVVNSSDASFWASEHDACSDVEIMIHRAAAAGSDEPRDSIADTSLSASKLREGEHVYLVAHDKYDCVLSDGSEDHHLPLSLAEVRRGDGSQGFTEDVNLQ